MAVYAIGDIQGCYSALQRLLKKIKFNKKKDTLWFCGDLVNRGPDSLKTLRFIRSLGDSARCVLGNHDLHLLALYYTSSEQKSSDTLKAVLNAPDVKDLMTWLRHQPLFYYDSHINCAMVHAGIYPEWKVDDCLQLSQEVEAVLQGKKHKTFFSLMYGNRPNRWNSKLSGMDRLRFITNVFTRMRYLDDNNNLLLKLKGTPDKETEKQGLPWFIKVKKHLKHNRVVFGHWSTLPSKQYDNFYALDSGCLWGGTLTAVKLSSKEAKWTRVDCT